MDEIGNVAYPIWQRGLLNLCSEKFLSLPLVVKPAPLADFVLLEAR